MRSSSPNEQGNRVGDDRTDAAPEESVPDQRALDGTARQELRRWRRRAMRGRCDDRVTGDRMGEMATSYLQPRNC